MAAKAIHLDHSVADHATLGEPLSTGSQRHPPAAAFDERQAT